MIYLWWNWGGEDLMVIKSIKGMTKCHNLNNGPFNVYLIILIGGNITPQVFSICHVDKGFSMVWFAFFLVNITRCFDNHCLIVWKNQYLQNELISAGSVIGSVYGLFISVSFRTSGPLPETLTSYKLTESLHSWHVNIH